MQCDNKGNADQEWRALIVRLSDGNEPGGPPNGVAPAFEDPAARGRVGVLITKAALGELWSRLYRLYCGDPSSPL